VKWGSGKKRVLVTKHQGKVKEYSGKLGMNPDVAFKWLRPIGLLHGKSRRMVAYRTRNFDAQLQVTFALFSNFSTYGICCFIRKLSLCLSLNFLNVFRNRAWKFLKFFLPFTEINCLKWVTFSLLMLYTWIWIPSLTFWME